MKTIEIVKGLANARGAEALREAVFVTEQGFSKEIEVDEKDPIAYHLVVYEKGEAVATARAFAEEPGVYHIGRVCVAKALRGQGIGRLVFRELEAFLRTQGATAATLGAQLQAEHFYKALGYEVVGDVFLEEGQPHVEMRKDLSHQ